MTDYAAVLAAIRPGTAWTLDGDEYAGLVWLDDSPKPTQKTLDDAWPQVEYQQQYDAVEAQRRTAYQVETDGMYFHAIRHHEALDDWEDAVAAIKLRYPYPQAPA